MTNVVTCMSIKDLFTLALNGPKLELLGNINKYNASKYMEYFFLSDEASTVFLLFREN